MTPLCVNSTITQEIFCDYILTITQCSAQCSGGSFDDSDDSDIDSDDDSDDSDCSDASHN